MRKYKIGSCIYVYEDGEHIIYNVTGYCEKKRLYLGQTIKCSSKWDPVDEPQAPTFWTRHEALIEGTHFEKRFEKRGVETYFESFGPNAIAKIRYTD